MKALVFGVDSGYTPPPDAAPPANPLLQGLAGVPMALREVPEPKLLGPDWVVLQPRLTGICGSDAKQVFMDMGGDAADMSMTAFISFPQVLGHEVVADVVEAGPEATGVHPGDRVVLQCWLSCGPRGIDPPCPACAAGDYQLCWNFTTGRLTPGIHTGNSSDATGGFAERMPAHVSQAIPVPDGLPDEVAVLADPFAVSLHSITRHPPPAGGRALVWGGGALGTCAIAILRALHPDMEVAAVVMHPAQQEMARSLGAHVVPADQTDEELVVALAAWSGATVLTPWQGLPITHPGRIDAAYDTIGSPRTLEVALRLLAPRSTLVVSGVHAAGRFEWSPWYFREVSIVGSNAFGVEEVDGVRKHALEHYLDFASSGRVDVSRMLTHTFPLDAWRDAFTTLAEQRDTGAIKVAFDFR